MVADPAKRAIFLQSVVEFIQKYNFDGLDFDWEYPGSRGGVPADKVCPYYYGVLFEEITINSYWFF